MIEEVFTSFGSAEIKKKEEALNQFIVDTFAMYTHYAHEFFVPIFPYVLVRILPKDMMIGRFYIPEVARSNKPTYEGIVLRVWKDKIFPAQSKGKEDWVATSDLKFGDHVVFPHYSGQPLPGLNENLYRAVPEGITRNGRVIFGNDAGVILGKINYSRPSIASVLSSVLDNALDEGGLETLKERLFNSLVGEFDLVPKQKGSLTTSGVSATVGA